MRGSGEQAGRALDACGFHYLVAGGVADEDQVTAALRALDCFRVRLDHHERQVSRDELPGHVLAHATEAAENVMALEAVDTALHSLSPQ